MPQIVRLKSLLFATAIAVAASATPALAESYFFRTKPLVEPPLPFSFSRLQAQEPNAQVQSAVVRIKGYDGAAVSVAGGDYQICSTADCSDQGATWLNAETRGVPGTFYGRVRLVTGGFGTTAAVRLTVGATSAEFAVATRDADADPDPITFAATTNATPGSSVMSPIVRLTGHDGITVSAANASYRVCSVSDCSVNTGWKSTPSTVARDAWVQLQATAPASGASANPAPTLSYGGRTASWAVTSKAASANPAATNFGIKDSSLAAALKSALGARMSSGSWVKCSVGSVVGDEPCAGASGTLVVATDASTGYEFGGFVSIDMASNTACWAYPSGFVFTNVAARAAYVMSGSGVADATGTVMTCGKHHFVMLQSLTGGGSATGLKANGTWQVGYTLTGAPEDVPVSATVSWYKFKP